MLELADQTDPILIQLDRLLDDDALFQRVRADLVRRYRWTAVHGRQSTPAEAFLRLLVVKHLYTWSYQEIQEQIADSLVLRGFARMYFRRVPDATTLLVLQQELAQLKRMPSMQLLARQRIPRLEEAIKQLVASLAETA